MKVRDVDDALGDGRRPAAAVLVQDFHRYDGRFGSDPLRRNSKEAVTEDGAGYVSSV